MDVRFTSGKRKRLIRCEPAACVGGGGGGAGNKTPLRNCVIVFFNCNADTH